MSWSKKDKVLFRTLQDFGKSDLEAQIKRSSLYLKNDPNHSCYLVIMTQRIMSLSG